MSMNFYQMVENFNQQNIFLAAENGNLMINAPKGSLTEGIKQLLRDNKQTIISALENNRNSKNSNDNEIVLSAIELEALGKFLGDDWSLYEHNKEALIAWHNLIDERTEITIGRVPQEFTATTYCASCQQYVFIPSGMENGGSVLGCPWCLNRSRGLPIPHPK